MFVHIRVLPPNSPPPARGAFLISSFMARVFHLVFWGPIWEEKQIATSVPCGLSSAPKC